MNFSRLSRRLLTAAIASGGLVICSLQARADIIVQVQEGTISTSGGVPSFTPTGAAQSMDISPASNFSFTTANLTINGNVAIGSDPINNAVSVSTGIALGVTSSFPLGNTQGLEVTIDSTGLPNSSPPGSPATFTNSAGGSNGGNSGGTISVSGTSTIAGVTSDISTNINNFTTSSVSSLPNPFSIMQTLLINITAQNGASTYSSGISTSVNTNAASVPAPAALWLGLIALPLLGSRRMLKARTSGV